MLAKNKASEEHVAQTILRGDEAQLRDILRLAREERLYKKKGIYQCIETRAKESATAARELNEINLISGIESGILGNISAIKKSFSSAADELYHSLWIFEYLQRSEYGLVADYPFQTRIETQFLDGANHKSEFDAGASKDHFLGYFSLVLKSLLPGAQVEEDIHLDVGKLHAAAGHLALSTEWDIFHERKNFWERSCAYVGRTSAGHIVDSSDSETVIAFRISLSRLRAFRANRFIDRLNAMTVRPDTRYLPLEEFRSSTEITSAYLLSFQFYSEALQESVHGLALCEWLRAYTVLKEIAVRYAKLEASGRDWSRMLLSASPAYYVGQMVNAGLTQAKAEIAVEHLTFGKHSPDILDMPLIPFGKNLLLAPVVTSMIEPGFSIESMLKSINQDYNHDLAIIGPGLEHSIMTSLVSTGIAASRLYTKVGRDEFECDVAFELDGVLFLCECKGKYEVTDFHGYLKLEKYLTGKAVEQQQRISMFYRSNLDRVRNALGLPSGWQPKKIVDLIVTSAKLGRAIEEQGVLITDENIFFGYFSRKKIDIRNGLGEVIATLRDERLEGQVNVDGFVDYVRRPANIALHRGFVEVRNLPIRRKKGLTVFRDVECYGEGPAAMPENVA